ncbi:porin [Ruegeria sediminis]|uniref:Porin n=1 Tax=Ruegeria sediminis TaxID=2583820 RepID=A0ABY2X007_9RHOB|nr:porin [Ruegeria sediminis]TMV08575.1 porin [Ruegeria sediminis]
MDSTATRQAVGAVALGVGLMLTATMGRSELPTYKLAGGYVFAPYGQLHFAYQSFDDGQEKTGNIVDITNSNSRLGFFIEPGSDLAALSFQFESGLGFRPSSKTSQTFTPKFWDWSRTDLRKVQFIHDSHLGTFRIGQGSMPTDGVAESNLGGTVVVAKSTIPEANGAYFLRASDGTLTGVTIGDTFDNFDGSRRLRLRYDTPAIAGFSLSAGIGKEVLKSGDDDRYYGFALRFDRSFDRFKVIGAIGSGYADGRPGTSRMTVGSISALDQRSGLYLSVAAGQSSEETQPGYIYVKGGWNTDLFDFGPTNFVIESFLGRDYAARASTSRMWGAGIIQNFEQRNLEVYGGYRSFSYDDPTPVSYQDAGAVQIGARVRF